VEAAALETGVVLQTFGGSQATVLGLSFEAGAEEVFNFEVASAHNYFVVAREGVGPGVLVHNGCDLDILGAIREISEGLPRPNVRKPKPYAKVST